jgi:hypothetical protein
LPLPGGIGIGQHGLAGIQRGAGLCHIFRPITLVHQRLPGLECRECRFGIGQGIALRCVVQPGQYLPGLHRGAFVHQHLLQAATHAEGQVHLADIHIAGQHQLSTILPCCQCQMPAASSPNTSSPATMRFLFITPAPWH